MPPANVDPKQQLKRLRSRMNLVLAIGAGIAVVWILFVVGFGNSGYQRFATIGTFGDAMAVVGMLAASGALYVSAYSMLLQREDIDQQIAEMQGSRRATERLVAAQSEDQRMRRWEQFLSRCNSVKSEIKHTMEHAWTHFRHAESLSMSASDNTRIKPKQAWAAVTGWHLYTAALHDPSRDAQERIEMLIESALKTLSDPNSESVESLEGRLIDLSSIAADWRQIVRRSENASFAP